MAIACELAKRCLPDYSSKFSRRISRCRSCLLTLVVREHQNKSYRGVEALLRDSEHWCKQIGMRRVPDLQHALPGIQGYSQWLIHRPVAGPVGAMDGTQPNDGNRLRRLNALRQRTTAHGITSSVADTYSSRDKNTANFRRSRSARRTPS